MWEAVLAAALGAMSAKRAPEDLPYLPLMPQPTPFDRRADKCPCCGSREFRVHREREICAYCRSGR